MRRSQSGRFGPLFGSATLLQLHLRPGGLAPQAPYSRSLRSLLTRGGARGVPGGPPPLFFLGPPRWWPVSITHTCMQGCQSNPIERTCRLSIAEFCIDWIIDWIAQRFHRLDFYRRIFLDYRFFLDFFYFCE